MKHLGTALRPQLVHDARGTVLVGDMAQRTLPAVPREPYLHVIVDRSAEHGFEGDVTVALRQAAKIWPDARTVRVTLANFEMLDVVAERRPLAESGVTPELLAQLPREGGLNVDLAVARGIRAHVELDLDSGGTAVPPRPVFVILSGKSVLRRPGFGLSEMWREVVPSFAVHEIDGPGGHVIHREEPAQALPLLRSGASIRPIVPDRMLRFESNTKLGLPTGPSNAAAGKC